MNIALIGTGRMGATISRLAAPDHRIVEQFDSQRPFRADALNLDALPDVVIDFSVPEAITGRVETCCHLGIPLVVGTTGWQQDRAAVEQIVRAGNGTLLWSANFSMGIAILRDMLRSAMPALNRLDDFGVQVHEVHHTRKVDSPSGTALSLASLLVDGLAAKSQIAIDDDTPGTDAIGVTAERVGDVIGQHSVQLTGIFDSITISHDALSRDGFAAGAILAAEWLIGRRGLYTFDDVFATGTLRMERQNGGNGHETEGEAELSRMHLFGV